MPHSQKQLRVQVNSKDICESTSSLIIGAEHGFCHVQTPYARSVRRVSIRKAAQQVQIRTGDKGFAILCLHTTWLLWQSWWMPPIRNRHSHQGMRIGAPVNETCLLVLSNGHGEDLITLRVLEEIHRFRKGTAAGGAVSGGRRWRVQQRHPSWMAADGSVRTPACPAVASAIRVCAGCWMILVPVLFSAAEADLD